MEPGCGRRAAWPVTEVVTQVGPKRTLCLCIDADVLGDDRLGAETHLYDVRDVAVPVSAECPDRRTLCAHVNDSFLPSARLASTTFENARHLRRSTTDVRCGPEVAQGQFQDGRDNRVRVLKGIASLRPQDVVREQVH